MKLVRFIPDFFEILDEIFQQTEGDETKPTRNHFETYDLWHIRDYFAEHWSDLPPTYKGRDDYRTYIRPGYTVAAVTVNGRLAYDGAIELVEIDIQFEF